MGGKFLRQPAWMLALCLSIMLAAGVAQATLTVGTNFTAETMKDLPALNGGFTFIPPDTNAAVGPNQIVELINGAYAVYNKTGGFVTSMGLDAFWKAAGVSPVGTTNAASFDPRLMYDPVTSRWFASSLDSGTGGVNNNFLLAVSNTSNPLDGWKGFSIPGAGAAIFTDFDGMGYNKDQVYLTSNNFPNVGATTTSILAIPKASLLAGNITGLSRFDLLNGSDTGFSIKPLVDPNGTVIENLYSDYNTPAGVLKLSQLLATNTNTPTLAPTTAAQFINANAYGLPPLGTQPGGAHNNIETGDNRFSAAVVKGGDGMVWGVQNVIFNSHAALRWVQIDPATNLVLHEGLIAKNGVDYYYGSVAVNSKGCIVIGFSGSSADPVNGFISAYAVEGTIVGGVPTFGDAILLKQGTDIYDVEFGGGRNRWGDYSATWVDPENEDIFWTIQEWASPDGTFSGLGSWSTQITELICAPVPLPPTMLLFGSGLLALAGWGRRRFCKN